MEWLASRLYGLNGHEQRWLAIGGGAASELNAASGTNTEIIAIGDGTASNYTGAVSNIVALGQGAGAFNGDSYSPSTFTPTNLIAIGQGAGTENGGSDIVAIGQSTAGRIATDSHDIIGIGNSDSVGSESGSGPTTLFVMHDVIGIGDQSLNRNKGNEVIAIGDSSLGQTNCELWLHGHHGRLQHRHRRPCSCCEWSGYA